MKTTTPLFLAFFLCINTYAQEHLEIRFIETKLTEESKKKLLHYISTDTKSVNDYILERFLNINENLAEERVIEVQKILEKEDKKIGKSVHYSSSLHIPFECNEKSDLDFFRIQMNKSEIKEEKSLAQVEHKVIKAKPAIIEDFEFHTIDPKTNNRIYLKKGCILTIPKDCFENDEGLVVNENVVLETSEIMSMKDAILAGTTTNMEDGYLESRGMLSLKGHDLKGKPIFIRQDKEIEVQVPSPKKKEKDFLIYEGLRENGSYDWILNGQKEPDFKNTSEYSRLFWGALTLSELEKNSRSKEIKILAMTGGGKSQSAIRNKLRKCRKYVHRKHRKNRKRRFAKRKNHEKHLHMNTKMILGDATHHWMVDSSSMNASIFGYYQYAVQTFGMYNIDRLLKTGETLDDLIVTNEKQNKINIFFKNQVILLAGRNIDNSSVFKFIPNNQEIVILSTRQFDDGRIELGFVNTISGKEKYSIENFKVYNRSTYEQKIQELTELSDTFSSR